MMVVVIADHKLAQITIPSAISSVMILAFRAVSVIIVAPVLVCIIVVMIVPIKTYHHIEK